MEHITAVCFSVFRQSMEYNDIKEKHPHLPKGAAIPRNQVAGHKHESRTKLGMLFIFTVHS